MTFLFRWKQIWIRGIAIVSLNGVYSIKRNKQVINYNKKSQLQDSKTDRNDFTSKQRVEEIKNNAGRCVL